MKRRNATRSALFTSIVSLLLCVSMLMGTTFAWFTDSVESGRNTIAAGNLDVELYANGDPVNSETVLFDDVNPNLWEPGAVAYENLLVKNVGSLALQYTLTLDVLNETVVNGYKLSDVIKVGVVNEKITSTDRNEVINKVTKWTKLSNFKLGMNALKLEAGKDSGDFAVILYWQPNDNETDNHYNMNNGNKGEVLRLDIGVSLIATQVVEEFDSFGNDYDGEATPWIGAINTDWYFGAEEGATEFTINTVDELAGLAAIVNGTATMPVTTFAAGSEATTVQDSFKGKTIKLGANIDLANSPWTPIGNATYSFQGTFDGGNYIVSNLKITGNGSNAGLFGFTTNGEIKNLTVENANVSGYLNVGVVAGTPYTSKYTNITVKGHVEVNGMSYVGGVGGKNAYANWDNITVNVDDKSYVKADSVEDGVAYRTYVGGVIGFMGEGGHKVSNVTSNIDVIGSTIDVGGIVGIAHYGNTFENITCTADVTCQNASKTEVGGIAGVWMNTGSNVTLTNCSFTGTINGKASTSLTGSSYSKTGNGKLIIDGKTTSTVPAGNVTDAVTGAQNGDTVIVGSGETSLPSLSGKEGLTIIGAADGSTVVGGENATTGFASSNFGKDTTIKNVTFSGSSNGVRWSYANGGTSTFENCTFAGDSTYGFHIDQSNGATFIFNNCTFIGFNAFASDLVKIEFNNCTFLSNGSYGHTNVWSIGEFNNCTWGDNTSVSQGYSKAEQKYYGTLIFDGVEESYHHEFIGSADSLVAFQQSVADGDAWKGQKVVLVDDIDLKNIAWTPINGFGGTFDGNGHTISNLAVVGESNVGFFSGVHSTAKIMNVVFDNANVSGTHYVGVVVGWEGNEVANATIDNCHVINSTVTCNTDANNDNGDKAGGIVGYAVSLNITNCSVKNTTIKAYRDFGGIIGYAHKYVVVTNNTVENVTLVIDNDVNYKNYTTDAEHDGNPVVGEAVTSAVVNNNTVK